VITPNNSVLHSLVGQRRCWTLFDSGWLRKAVCFATIRRLSPLPNPLWNSESADEIRPFRRRVPICESCRDEARKRNCVGRVDCCRLLGSFWHLHRHTDLGHQGLCGACGNGDCRYRGRLRGVSPWGARLKSRVYKPTLPSGPGGQQTRRSSLICSKGASPFMSKSARQSER
jgi:hypothetical protein